MKKTLNPTEDEEQATLFEYASWQKDPEWALLFSIPNGGFRKLKTAIRLKKTGLKAGIPDLFLPVARKSYHGLFIEMKSINGVTQLHQKEWHIKLREQGYMVEVCKGCSAAVKIITDYLSVEERL